MIDYRVYLVTDEPSRYTGNWLANIEQALAGGVTCVQYRDTENGAKIQYARACTLLDLLKAHHVPLIINNDVALALAVGAQGVHVGQGDLPPSVVRRLVGDQMEIGYSLTAREQLKDYAAEIAVADCLGVGPVFNATQTKHDAAPEMGVETFSILATSLHLADKKVVAIGGLTPENSRAVIGAGADGLAVVSAFSRATDPSVVAQSFCSCFK